MDLLLLQRLVRFLQVPMFANADARFYVRTCVYMCLYEFFWAPVTSYAVLSPPLCERQKERTMEGEGARTRLLDGPGNPEGVLLLFSLHCHTRRRCFVCSRGKKLHG